MQDYGGADWIARQKASQSGADLFGNKRKTENRQHGDADFVEEQCRHESISKQIQM
jgi:hypothetical protein